MPKTNFSTEPSRRRFFKTSLLTGAAAFAAPSIVPASVFGAQAPSNRIQIGAIGVGRISREHDLPEIMAFDQARVVAVCDLDSKRLQQGQAFVETNYAKKGVNLKVRTYADYEALLKSPDIDAVVISTPDHWHAKPAIEAAKAGKHVYLQKPATLTIAEGRAMSDMVHRCGIVFQLGTQQRSIDHFRIAAELVRNGRIGRVHTVQIGLPTDPSGEEQPEMPIPANLNYEKWLGSTPWVYYTEKRVHPQNDYSRPGWLRCEQFGAGMITGWGVHHFDIAHWGLGTEFSGPLEVEAWAEFPTRGLWDVHGKYRIEMRYPNDVRVQVSDELPIGVRFEGSEGWIFVTRGNYSVTASDPVANAKKEKALSASDAKILESKIGPNEINLIRSRDQHGNWLECIRSRQLTISPVEVGHRSTSVCLVGHIAMKLKRKVYWDPILERFKNDDEANAMISRPQRAPYQL
ncbi:MAG TPA: Gfo/Idh/MocA family oxidoreductase [bacterium]|mgnify:CR=1 FL=1|nr:Gfo/Idh/MocA family oxidoreductase [bacterium]HPN35726.1 Gfo/Idh/MocA family oxidoreductase [bacterium]